MTNKKVSLGEISTFFNIPTLIIDELSIYPIDKSINVQRPPQNLSVRLIGTNMKISLWFFNITSTTHKWEQIKYWENESSGYYTYEQNGLPATEWIWGNTTYTWSINITNGFIWINKTFTYTTKGSRYDVNNNNMVNFQDAGLVWTHRTSLVPYDGLYDVNEDGNVNFQDAGLTWIHRD